MKLIQNTGKRFKMISNGGRYILSARMKVDYDLNNDVFGAREWIYTVYDERQKKECKFD